MTGRLLSTGSVLVDLTLAVPHLPEAGGDVLATAAASHVGGGGNVMVAARRQGVETDYLGLVGSGPHGSLAAAALDGAGIGWSGTMDPAGDTGVCVNLLDPRGRPTFVTAPGVESRLTDRHLADVVVRPDDVVAVSGYDLLYPVSGPTLLTWLGALPASTRVVLDPGPLVADLPDTVWRELGPRLGVLTLNRREADLIGGATTLRERCRLAPGGLLVVRDGAAGCTWSVGDAEPRPVPTLAVDVVDTTGAGDAHTGVLVAGLLSGRVVPDALHRANVAASLSTTRPGPATCPTAAQLDAALA